MSYYFVLDILVLENQGGGSESLTITDYSLTNQSSKPNDDSCCITYRCLCLS